MSHAHDQVDPDRLLQAADAVLEAVIEIARAGDGAYVHPPHLMGTDLQPACLSIYSPQEVREATDFLIRLCVLPSEAEL